MKLEQDGPTLRLMVDGELRWTCSDVSGGHHDFAELPDGREVLFVSAPSYMGIRVVDVATGAVLYAFDPASDGCDFCHADYQVIGRHLLTFGCFWAGPYGVRVYDLGPMLDGATGVDTRPPFPLLWEAFPTFEDEILLVPSASVPLILPSYVLPPWVEDCERADHPFPEVLAKLDALNAPEAALWLQEVDMKTGEHLRFHVEAIPLTEEIDLHPQPTGVAIPGGVVRLID
jgi:hypothetical protein